jgi:AP2 domain
MRTAARHPTRRRTINPDLPRFVYPNGNGFRALIRSGDKILYLGTFDTPEKASEAAERMAKELRGKANARSKRPHAIAAKAKSRRQAAKSRRPRAG